MTLSSKRPQKTYTQRDLLALVLACATSSSASFTQARHAVARATGESAPRALTRELLSDLAIRNWIELCKPDRERVERSVPRTHYELELANDVNWEEGAAVGRARYALTEKGRERVAPMLSDLTGAA
jgi:hypothetical protein